jgi:hypothetical protein
LHVLRWCPHNRYDFARQGVLHHAKEPRDPAKAVGTNDKQVDIALLPGGAGSHGPKHEREGDSSVDQRDSQLRYDARCLQDNFAKWCVQWVAFCRTHIPAIAISPVGQQAGSHEAIEFELDGAGRKSREAHELPEVQLTIGRTKGFGEDGSPGAGCEDFQGGS